MAIIIGMVMGETRWGSAFEKLFLLADHCGKPPDPRADIDAEPFGVAGEPGILHGLLGGRDSVLRKKVETLGCHLVNITGDVKILDLGGDLRLIIGGIKVMNQPDAGNPIGEILPESGDVVSHRGNGAEAGDYNSLHSCSPLRTAEAAAVNSRCSVSKSWCTVTTPLTR